MLFFTRGYIISQESFLSAEASSKPFPCVSPEPQPRNENGCFPMVEILHNKWLLGVGHVPKICLSICIIPSLLKHIETEQKTETTKISIPPRPIFAASTFDLVDLGQVRFRGRRCFEASLTAVLLVHVVVVGSRLSHFPVGWTGESELLIGNSNIWPKNCGKLWLTWQNIWPFKLLGRTHVCEPKRRSVVWCCHSNLKDIADVIEPILLMMVWTEPCKVVGGEWDFSACAYQFLA